jgi:SiaC family regulatory phosphoprotein
MIKSLQMTATESTPEVVLDKQSNLFIISGDILPENSFELFDPIYAWFNEYLNDPDDLLVMEFAINIINTSSTRRLVFLFRIFEKIADKGTKVKVIWRHLPDDEIMQYTAYEFGNAFTRIQFESQIK